MNDIPLGGVLYDAMGGAASRSGMRSEGEVYIRRAASGRHSPWPLSSCRLSSVHTVCEHAKIRGSGVRFAREVRACAMYIDGSAKASNVYGASVINTYL